MDFEVNEILKRIRKQSLTDDIRDSNFIQQKDLRKAVVIEERKQESVQLKGSFEDLELEIEGGKDDYEEINNTESD